MRDDPKIDVKRQISSQTGTMTDHHASPKGARVLVAFAALNDLQS